MFEQFHEICAIQIALVFFVIIECVHDGHVGGPKQYTDFPLGNIFSIFMQIYSIVLVLQHGRRAHTLLIYLPR